METKIPSIRVPPLPDLAFNIALQVFTDISLRPHDDNGSRQQDNEILSVMGKSACSTVFTSILCTRTPALCAEDIITAREEWMSDTAMMTWVNYYKDTIIQVRRAPGTALSTEIMTRTWYAYLGGIHMTRGHQALEQFLRQIVDPPTETPHPLPVTHNHVLAPETAMKSDGQGQYISMLHGVAAKRGVKIKYESESSGPQHSLNWIVTVLVDGEWKGQGRASSKQTAKEEAAKAAFNQLHWA